eukprot:483543_1
MKAQIFFIILHITLTYSDIECNNLWSAINTMQLGVDLITFDIFGHSPGWSTLPILQYTCNKNKTWINSINKIQYDLPDQLAEQPISIPDDVTYTSSHQTTTTKGVEVWMSASISKSYFFGMCSKTKTMSDAYGVIESNSRLWGTENSSVSAFKVNFMPYELDPQLIRLSDSAQTYIDQNIKPNGSIFNESTVELYETFFKYFGTHVFSTAETGGAFHLRYETDKVLLAEMSSSSISEQGSISFWNFLDDSGAVSGGKKQVDARFTETSTVITVCKGGSFCPTAQSNDYDQWQISVASTPWIMNAEFFPVYKLIYNDITIANSFAVAILNHQQMSYMLNEIQPNIEMVKQAIHDGLQTICWPNSCEYLNNCSITECTQNGNYYDCNGAKQANCLDKQMRQVFDIRSDNKDVNVTSVNELADVQQMLLQQLNTVEMNIEVLLKLNVIRNQTMFNQTGNLWENVLQYTQSEYTSAFFTYNANEHNCEWSATSATCSLVTCTPNAPSSPCDEQNFQNVTFLKYWLNWRPATFV